MTDMEPRRSGRKTKGQHTRNSEVHEQVQPTLPKTPSRRKSMATKQPTPAASSPAPSTPELPSEDEDGDEDDPNAQIRCACGATKEQKGDTRMMVQCEGCKVWQHCECLELDEDELDNDKDKLYYCEVCKPELHEEFLAKVERGEKPWETARKNRARRKKSRRSTGKARKGKGAQAKKKTSKKDELEPEVELEVEPEPEPKHEGIPAEKGEQGIPLEAEVEASSNPPTEREPSEKPEEVQSGTVESEHVVDEEVDQVIVREQLSNDGVQQGEKQETPEQDVQISLQQEGVQEDVLMDVSDDREIAKIEHSSREETTASSSMPPPDVPQSQLKISLEAVGKEDEEMVDVPEASTLTVMTPTTPTTSRHRESKRKGSMPEPQRPLRRKTTHDSDGDYQSDDDIVSSKQSETYSDKSKSSLGHQPHKHRRASASSASKQDTAKEMKPSQRRPSVPKPLPRKPSGPDDISVQAEVVEKVDDLRNNARRTIVNFLTPIVEKVVQQNLEILSEEQKAEDYPVKLTLEIEHHLYLALWNQHSQSTPQYKLKARGIGLNLPKNPVLQSRLLKGEVTPEKLVQMKPEEMASEEFQMLAEQVRRESEIQNTLVAEDTGPRIRRTHKGEEIVEDDISRSMGNDEPVYSAARGVDHVMEDAPSPRSRAVSQVVEDYPISPSHQPSEDFAHTAQPGSAPQTPRTPLSARTPITGPRGRQFSIEGVWSNVNTPEGPTHPKTTGSRQPPHMLSLRTAAQPKSAIDADIDKLLAEEDHDMDNETPPYSPSELTFTDATTPIWQGRISMVSVSNFPARAHLLGGPEDAQQKLLLSDLLGSTVLIDGRIAIDRATEYLCGQKFSNTNEIVVLSIEPEDHIEPQAGGEFNKLFQYFQKKERYGVIGKPAHKAIKDCYLVPIDTRDDMPDFFETLTKHSLDLAPRKKRVFAVVFVLSKIVLAEEQKRKSEERKVKKEAQNPQSPMKKTPTQHSPPTQDHISQQQQPVSAAAQLAGFIGQQDYSGRSTYKQIYGQQQQQYQYAHGNGYHQQYYQGQPQAQPLSPQLPHHQASPPPTGQQSQKQGGTKLNFTPWKELQDVLSQLTDEQVEIINHLVAQHPAAQSDPGLLARLIQEHKENRGAFGI